MDIDITETKWAPIPFEKLDLNKFPTNEELVSLAFHVNSLKEYHHVGEIYFHTEEYETKEPIPVGNTFEECQFNINTEDFSTGWIHFYGSNVTHEVIGALIECWRTFKEEINEGLFNDKGERVPDNKNNYGPQDLPDDKIIGQSFFFEYHCTESNDSQHAKLWHHSHQACLILKRDKDDAIPNSTFSEREESGMMRYFSVKFHDGYIGTVGEDELFYDKKDFYRPDPPENVKDYIMENNIDKKFIPLTDENSLLLIENLMKEYDVETAYNMAKQDKKYPPSETFEQFKEDLVNLIKSVLTIAKIDFDKKEEKTVEISSCYFTVTYNFEYANLRVEYKPISLEEISSLRFPEGRSPLKKAIREKKR